MSGYHQGQYDDGYGHQGHQGGNTDSYYQDDGQYYDQQHEGYHDNQHHGGEGYYDES